MMDTERRRRLREIFDTLSDQPPEDRNVHLDTACGTDSEMRRELESLLKASDSAGGFFSAPESHVRGPLDDHDETGGRAGRYELVEKLGEGGFGIVYLAEQRHPLRRHVAVKVIKPGMDSRQVIARFEAERQALALMDHPNIARVHDAGTNAAGRPYFVMELVRGRPVTTYCDENRLTVSERLRLFVDVCRAVQHAHQKGIIHRDLKPSNVLVAEQDGKPVPKVIDFGVAKAVSGRLTEATFVTECRQLVGTVEYMSPEQTGAAGADVDTRADVYSLGALLYELLAGAAPFDGSALRSRPYGEIQRVIAEVDPPSPGAMLAATPAKARASVAAARGTDAAALARGVRGDLDWVVMKCLEKDRARRYDSAGELAADVARHLKDEPVQARPAGVAYRARKLLRRHRLATAAAAAVVAALVLGIAGTGVGLARAVAARKDALAAAKQRGDALARAEKEAESARAANGFVQDLLGRSDAEVFPSGRKMKAADLLDEADEKAAERFVGSPEGEMEARLRLGRSYLSLAMFEEASANLRRARDLAERLRGGDDELTLRITGRLVDALRAPRPHESESLARAAYAAALARYGPSHPRSREARRNLADTLSAGAISRHDEALPLYLEDLGAARADPTFTPTQLAYVLGDVGWVLYCCGRFEEAEPYLRENLEVAERSPDAPRHLRAFAPYMLALLLDAAGKDAEADAFYRRSLGRVVAWRGEGHPDARKVRAAYARFLARVGRHDQAVALRQAAIDAAGSPATGTDDAGLAEACTDLADALKLAGEDAAADAALRRAVEARRRAFGGEDAFARAGWRKSVLWSALGPASTWGSEALFAQVWFAAEELLLAHGPARLRPDEPTDVKLSRYRLERQSQGGRPDVLAPVAEGLFEGLKGLDDQPPGLYRLTLESPRRGESSPAARSWLLLCDWDVSIHPLPDSRPDPYVWKAITARPPAHRRTTRGLALTGAAAATGGRVSGFGLVATADVRVAPGLYRFVITSDDGVRLWVDDRLVVDAWQVRQVTTSEVDVTFSRGHHRLRVEYFRHDGGHVLWLRAAPAPTAPAGPERGASGSV